MRHHSIIIDDYLFNPDALRHELMNAEMIDYKASDGVIYPGIVPIPDYYKKEIISKLNMFFQERVDESQTLTFARFSFETMAPPHWAHSDYNMTDWVGLLYLNQPQPGDGTHLVRHKKTGMELHPKNDEEMHILLNECNDRSLWDITFTCPARYNRMFIVNAYYLHAAATKYGTNKEDSRLVATTFFKLESLETP